MNTVSSQKRKYELKALPPACSAHYLAQNPPPDPPPMFEIEDPAERVEAVLSAFYAWYRANEGMQLRVQGERATVPELEDWMAKTADARQAELADALAAGFRPRG